MLILRSLSAASPQMDKPLTSVTHGLHYNTPELRLPSQPQGVTAT